MQIDANSPYTSTLQWVLSLFWMAIEKLPKSICWRVQVWEAPCREYLPFYAQVRRYCFNVPIKGKAPFECVRRLNVETTPNLRNLSGCYFCLISSAWKKSQHIAIDVTGCFFIFKQSEPWSFVVFSRSLLPSLSPGFPPWNSFQALERRPVGCFSFTYVDNIMVG